MTTIVHNVYYEGKVQSLGFHSSTRRASVGVIEPGVYNFGIVATSEEITVISGRLQINGRWYDAGETCIVSAGGQVIVSAEECASYLCLYGA